MAIGHAGRPDGFKPRIDIDCGPGHREKCVTNPHPKHFCTVFKSNPDLADFHFIVAKW